MAGVGRMDLRTFATFNVLGALLWSVGVTMLGFALGKTIPSVRDHLVIVEAIIIFLSVIPVGVEVVRSRRERQTKGPVEARHLVPEPVDERPHQRDLEQPGDQAASR